jgi:hypothetical protein
MLYTGFGGPCGARQGVFGGRWTALANRHSNEFENHRHHWHNINKTLKHLISNMQFKYLI